MIQHSWKTHLSYAMAQVNILRGKRKRENERRRRKSEQLSIAEKGCGIDHKLDCWSTLLEP
jgi:hypothetical protein